MGAKTLLTVAQFEQLPEIEGISYELDQGELVELPSPNPIHNRTQGELFAALHAFCKAHPDAGLVFSELDFQLSDDVVRRPDVALIGQAQMERIDWQGNLQRFGPVLAAEIVSPSNSFTDLLRKQEQYMAAGARTVWILVPSREVYVYTAGERP